MYNLLCFPIISFSCVYLQALGIVEFLDPCMDTVDVAMETTRSCGNNFSFDVGIR